MAGMVAGIRSRPEVEIGLLFSTTGTYRTIGTAMLSGALLAIEEISADASFDFKLTPVIENPGGSVPCYYACCETLLRKRGVSHVVGCYTSSSRKEVIPFFERCDALLWYPSHYEGFECSDNVIYVGASPNQHIVPLAGYLMSAFGRRGYCVGSNYIWPWESTRIMRQILEANGGTVVAERYLPLGVKDVKHIIDEIGDLEPDFIYNSLIGESCYAFIEAYSAASARRGSSGLPLPIIASCTLSEPELLALRPEARGGHISSSVYFQTIDSAENHRFIHRYRKRFGSSAVASADAEASYVAVLLLAHAIRRARSTEIEAVRRATHEFTLEAPQGAVHVDSENNHCHLTPRLGRSTKNGDFEILYTADGPLRPDPYLVWFDPIRDTRNWSSIGQDQSYCQWIETQEMHR